MYHSNGLFLLIFFNKNGCIFSVLYVEFKYEQNFGYRRRFSDK